MNHLVKLNWLDRAIQVRQFHIQCLKEHPRWTIEKTAAALSRSKSSVAYDIEIAEWVKTHEKQLRRFDSLREAITWITNKKREMSLE